MTLKVNGAAKDLRVEPRETLLSVLRLPLDLTGAKPVCDRGAVRRVHGAGSTASPVYACTLLAVECEGREVTTVEGLGTPAAMHPVQAAFVARGRAAVRLLHARAW